MCINNEALRVYNHYITDLVESNTILKEAEMRRKMMAVVLCEKLNFLRQLAKKIAEESDNQAFEKAFFQCSEQLRKLVLNLEFLNEQVEKAKLNCQEFIDTHANMEEKNGSN